MIDFPKPWPLFWMAIMLSLGYMAFSLFKIWTIWSRGINPGPTENTDFRRTAMLWLAEVFLQRQLFNLSFLRWAIHILIFYGFVGLSLVPALVFALKVLGYNEYIFVKLMGDSFGLLLLLGLAMAFMRRLALRPTGQTGAQEDMLLLALLLSVTISGFVLEGLRIALVPAEIARYSFVGRLFVPPGTYTIEQLRPWLTACWTIHVMIVASLFIYLPHSKLVHSIFAPVTIAMNASVEHKREDLYWPDIKKHRAPR